MSFLRFYPWLLLKDQIEKSKKRQKILRKLFAIKKDNTIGLQVGFYSANVQKLKNILSSTASCLNIEIYHWFCGWKVYFIDHVNISHFPSARCKSLLSWTIHFFLELSFLFEEFSNNNKKKSSKESSTKTN